MTSPSCIFSTRRTPSTAGLNIRAKAGERWSSVGMSQALRMLSGMLVGPGMKTGFWNDMCLVLTWAMDQPYAFGPQVTIFSKRFFI